MAHTEGARRGDGRTCAERRGASRTGYPPWGNAMEEQPMRTIMARLVAVLGLLLGALTLGAVASADTGNSDAAHACQQGGYANYARADGTTFANTGECVSYAADGGRLVRILHPAITATETTTTIFGTTGFVIVVSGTGFTPGGTVSLDLTFLRNGTVVGSLTGNDSTTATATGAIGPYQLNYQNPAFPCSSAGNPTSVVVTATDATTGVQTTTTVAVPC